MSRYHQDILGKMILSGRWGGAYSRTQPTVLPLVVRCSATGDLGSSHCERGKIHKQQPNSRPIRCRCTIVFSRGDRREIASLRARRPHSASLAGQRSPRVREFPQKNLETHSTGRPVFQGHPDKQRSSGPCAVDRGADHVADPCTAAQPY